MSTQILQSLLLALILLASAFIALRHLLPNAVRRIQSAIARALSQPRRHAGVRRLGYWLQPKEAKEGQCGSGLGCSSCAGCGSASTDTVASIPLKFPPHPVRRAG
ncbi:DUF6587 family protein [Dokdonella sp.]|uniref:DUF6587 family protein n=1 Tax=Dokdonella sp. TaxID=2291710 RepID=UPI003C6FF652